MSFTNLYYQRIAGTAKACYVCYKPTTTVLATANTIDFLYACPGHLTDPGFATPLGETGDGVGAGASKKMGLSPEEIQKVKEEWEEKQKRLKEKEKEEKEKEKEKEKNGEDKDKAGEDKTKKDADKKKSTPIPVPIPKPPPQPTHPRFALHRDFFAMRLTEHRKRRQTAQAKDLAPRLPGAPRGPLPGSWPV